jgi:hypothetical protein
MTIAIVTLDRVFVTPASIWMTLIPAWNLLMCSSTTAANTRV